MMGFVRTILTEDDANRVWDIIRVVGALATINFLAMADYDVVALGHHFEPQAYGQGFGILVAGIGAALFANSKANP